MRKLVRCVVWAALLTHFVITSFALAANDANKQPKDMQMSNLALTLQLPNDVVVSGENFAVQVIIENIGNSATNAPADFGDDDYRFQFTPHGGGEPIVITRQAFETSEKPGSSVERLKAPTEPITEELAPGETRVTKVYPARLSANPLPEGAYELSISLISAPEIISKPVNLTVEALNILQFHSTGGNPISGSELSYLHQDSSGNHQMFGGKGKADAPTWSARLRIAEIKEPIENLKISHALHVEGDSGPLMLAWLSNQSELSIAVAQSTYLVAKTDPINLGLESSSLAPTGWKFGNLQFSASFAVMGLKGDEIELALVSVSRDSNWSPEIQRFTLPLPKLPEIWRISKRLEGGYILFASYASGNGAYVLKQTISENDTVLEKPVKLIDIELPLIALSSPLVVSKDANLQALTGFSITERGAVMNLHFIPVDGSAQIEKHFVIPVVDEKPPGGWSLAEGAPTLSAIVVHSGNNIYGLRYDAGDIKRGKILVSDINLPQGLSVIVIGAEAWAVWKEGTKSIKSQPFPR